MKKTVKNSLQQEWIGLTPQGVSISKMLQAFDRIQHSYADPQRRFHTLSAHIRSLLKLQKEYFADASLPVVLAIWFHDIFYLPGYGHSETVSADMMRAILHGIFPKDIIEEAARHILATIDHAASSNPDTQIMCDLDLLGLASDPDEYDAGVRHIRAEYDQFTDEEWKMGRTKFLSGLLDRTSIFQTEAIRTWFESAARSNLERDLAACS